MRYTTYGGSNHGLQWVSLTSATGFDGKTTHYVYSNAGHLTATECAGVRTDFARDAQGTVYHDASGRALRLPALTQGAERRAHNTTTAAKDSSCAATARRSSR